MTRVGIVGAGVMGRRHEAALVAIGAEVVGVLDRADADGLDLVDELARRGAAAFVVATPASAHLSLARACIDRGLHVLIEKPLADTIHAAEELDRIASARAGDLVVAVGHVERFSPAVADVDCTSAAHICTIRRGPRPARVLDVDVLLDLAVHDVDLVRHLARSEYEVATVVDAAIDDAGTCIEASIVARLVNGVEVEHHVSWLDVAPTRHLVVDGRTLPLAAPVGASLEAQDRAFLRACAGDRATSLATTGDGVAAIRVVGGALDPTRSGW